MASHIIALTRAGAAVALMEHALLAPRGTATSPMTSRVVTLTRAGAAGAAVALIRVSGLALRGVSGLALRSDSGLISWPSV